MTTATERPPGQGSGGSSPRPAPRNRGHHAEHQGQPAPAAGASATHSAIAVTDRAPATTAAAAMARIATSRWRRPTARPGIRDASQVGKQVWRVTWPQRGGVDELGQVRGSEDDESAGTGVIAIMRLS
jgi:hypothetical protein